MSIETSDRKARYTWRTNPYAPTEIDRKRNQYRATWKFYKHCDTPEEARLEVIRLSQETEQPK